MLKYLTIGILSLFTTCAENKEQVPSKSIYVIDGDTIAIGDDRIRLMGLDTPETYRAKCASEKALGDKATDRLRQLIKEQNYVEMALEPRKDKYGRGLAKLFINGENVADILIGEGLARPYRGGKRQGWC